MFNLDRQRLFDRVDLDYGGHKGPDDGLCAMEMVAYLAGEAHSYNPNCACPVLTAYTIRLNDAMPPNWRQQLKPYLPLFIDSRDGREVERAELFAWRAIRLFLPIALDACGHDKTAEKLRSLKGGLNRASDAAYAAYTTTYGAPAAIRGACVQAAHAAHAAHCAGAGRAAHVSRAVEASDAADTAITAARVTRADTVWPLALQTLDDALEIGAETRARREAEGLAREPIAT